MDANLLDTASAPRLLSLNQARCDFVSADHAQIAALSGSTYDPDSRVIKTVYLGKPIAVDCENAKIYPQGSDRVFRETDHLLILHGLLWAKGTPLTGRLVSYRELPGGGHLFYNAFKKASIDLLAAHFSEEPRRLARALDRVSAELSTIGDASVKLSLLPRLPAVYAIWGRDEEFPASANILFDSSAADYLHVEDLAVIGSFGAYELIDNA
jgi:hypothetical protein